MRIYVSEYSEWDTDDPSFENTEQALAYLQSKADEQGGWITKLQTTSSPDVQKCTLYTDNGESASLDYFLYSVEA